jgi:hypothetical protein
MLALPGILALMVSIYARPYEWNHDLAQIPFLYIAIVFTMFGFMGDLAARRTRMILTPILPLATFFTLWTILSITLTDPSLTGPKLTLIVVPYTLYFLIAHGVQSVKSYTKLIFTIFGLGIFVAYVGAAQGLNPFGCMIINPDNPGGRLYHDGDRICPVTEDKPPQDAVEFCYQGGKNVMYKCEKFGPFVTSSVDGGRVRYLGVLTDPNELALATSLAIPFAFAFFELKRTTLRLAMLVGSVGLIALEVVFTKSRGGQLVFATVLGAYFVRKYGIKRGVIVAGVMAVPLLLLGGRSGNDSDQSTIDRLEAAAAAIKLLLVNPLWGCGFTQFTEHHPLTAHNAYLLSAAEEGIPGLLSFSCILLLAVKTTVTALRWEYAPDDPEAYTLRTLAMAMLATFSGAAIGVFFLSWTYHFVLWIHFGLAGSFYCVMKTKYPNFVVRVTTKEFGLVILAWTFILIAFTIHIKRKGCW